MSELDKLNAGVKLSMAARRKAAVARIAITVLWVLAALGVFIGLQAIHFISLVFMVILMAIAVCVGTFKIPIFGTISNSKEDFEMMNKYWAFRKLIDFVADYSEVTDANMNNYAGDIEITGTDEDGSTINIRVHIEEGKEDGN